jgi:transcription elongation factor GreB
VSKAFTRESDDSSDAPLPLRQSGALPPGAKNYVTPNGAKQLREELDRLVQVERPKIATARSAGGSAVSASADEPLRRRQAQILDQRISHLEQSLQSAIIVQPPAEPWSQIRFGATVTVRESDGSESRYRIVGADEADVDRDWVSWCSPLARALVNARLGQRVRFRVPAGEREVEIVAITYE